MSDLVRHRNRVAGLRKNGASAERVAAAYRVLAMAKVRQDVDTQRARVGLPPLADDQAAAVTAVAFLGEAA